MKKIILALGLFFGMLTASAQGKTEIKIGYIATDELVGLMPEAEQADAELKEYQSSLAQQGQDMMKDLSQKDSIFVKDSSKLTPSMREIKKRELMDLYQKVQGWNQQAQDLYQSKAQEKIAPLRAKAMEAIKAVAKENGYSYILDASSVLYGPPGDDILGFVKTKLGVKDQKPAVPGKRN